MDYFLGPVSLILIMILLVGATIKINEFMSGKIMDFLSNKRLLPSLVLHLKKIHLSNLEDAEEQESEKLKN